jgi:hypothetical protein
MSLPEILPPYPTIEVFAHWHDPGSAGIALRIWLMLFFT